VKNQGVLPPHLIELHLYVNIFAVVNVQPGTKSPDDGVHDLTFTRPSCDSLGDRPAGSLALGTVGDRPAGAHVQSAS
jgi:hypothetical protein